LVYWTLADTLAVASIIFDAWSILIAYTITRLTGGAPKAWFLIIAAFGVLLIYTMTLLFFDIQSPDSLISDTETSISLIVGLLFAIGLFLLLKTFQRQVKAANPARPQP
jgi:quinol-cytochrome oxidoreductase complex cytochrome b subunit